MSYAFLFDTIWYYLICIIAFFICLLSCYAIRSVLSRAYRGFIDGLSRLSRWYIPHFPLSLFPSFSPSAAYLRQGYPFGVLCSALSTPSLSLSRRVSVAVFCSRRYSAVCLLSPMQSYNIFFKNANNYSLFCTIVPKNLQMSINFRTFAHSITK